MVGKTIIDCIAAQYFLHYIFHLQYADSTADYYYIFEKMCGLEPTKSNPKRKKRAGAPTERFLANYGII